MGHGEIFEYEPGWLACVGQDITHQVRLPAGAKFDPGTDRIVRVQTDVLLLQAVYGVPYGPDRDELRQILNKHINWDLF